jgi:hypothetical protein
MKMKIINSYQKLELRIAMRKEVQIHYEIDAPLGISMLINA